MRVPVNNLFMNPAINHSQNPFALSGGLSAVQGQQVQNPFALPSNNTPSLDLGNQAIQSYFEDMRKAIGKSDNQFSDQDFSRFEQILVNARDLLDDTIQFSERASSPTDLFQQQKQELEKNLSMTKAIANFFKQQSPGAVQQPNIA